MTFRTGTLRHRIELQSRTPYTNTAGDQEPGDWETYATVWAAINPISAREFITAQQSESEVMARITINFRDDVTAAHRCKHGANIYNIHGVLPDQDSGLEYLTLPVSKGVNDG